MELNIYSQDGTLKLIVSPSLSSTVTEEVMGENCTSVNFIHSEYVQLEVNDYILVGSVKYKIRSQYRPTKKHSSKYDYQVKFWAPIHDAQDVLFLFTADNEMQSEFSYDASPREHLQMWVDNMNRNLGSAVWSIGSVISAGNKTIEYRNMYCWDAAFGSNGIAAAFNTEMWADGFVINLCKAERGERISLGYMQGLTKLVPAENPSAKFFTRLYPMGSTRNIDASKYGYKRLQLPSGKKYVDKNTDLYGIKDGYEESAFTDIYPHFIGTVSSVRSERKNNETGREYIVYYIKDDSMNFNPNGYSIPEFVKHVSFQTGDLAGHGDADGSFEANWLQESKEWEIINIYPDEETQLPGGVLIPKVGDTYIPWNFSMPVEYNTIAEKEFEAAVNTYLQNCSFDPTQYEAQTDRNYIEKNNISLFLGENVQLNSSEYFNKGHQDSRIIKIIRKLNDLSQATIICSDKTTTGWKLSVDNSISDLKFKVSKKEKEDYDIIKTTDIKTPSDTNVFSALKSLSLFLRKDKDDVAEGNIQFVKNISSNTFATGLTGNGWRINQYGDIEGRSLFLREWLETPELRYRRTTVTGDEFWVSTGLKVDKVEGNKITAKLEEGEIIAVHTGDILRGIYNHSNGFNTSFIKVISVDSSEGTFTFEKIKGSDPVRFMTFARQGNVTDTERQRSIYLSGLEGYQRFLGGVDSADITSDNIYAQFGNLNGLVTPHFGTLSGEGIYIRNGYIEGSFHVTGGNAATKDFVTSEVGKNIVDLAVGTENLLLNTGFAGDYLPAELENMTLFNRQKILYSDPLKFWAYVGTATVNPDNGSKSGYACSVSGRISQSPVMPFRVSEKYVVSFLVKGNGLLKVSIGGETEDFTLTPSYTRIVKKFIAINQSPFALEGNSFTICEIKLERGTVATDWTPAFGDNNRMEGRLQTMKYVFDSLKNETSIYGGLVLTNILMLGNYINGKMSEVTAGLSGVYKDGNDVAFWAGGTLEQAIAAIKNPSETKDVANAVITHSGMAVFNHGYFRGTVYAENGYFQGTIETSSKGNRILISSSDNSLKMINKYEHPALDLGFIDIHEEQSLPYMKMYLRRVNGELAFTSILRPDGFQIEHPNLGLMAKYEGSSITLLNMPKKDPHSIGVFWNDNGNVRVSQG